MIHTLENRYIIPRSHSFLAELKYFAQGNKSNSLQQNYIYNVYFDNQNKFKGYTLKLDKLGISFEYAIMKNPLSYLMIQVNLNKLLNKKVIVSSDLEDYKHNYYSFINRVFNKNEFLKSETLNRIDYKYDYTCRDEEEKQNLLAVASMASDSRYSITKKTPYQTAVYFNGEDININIYDKFAESGLEEHRNIIRYEIQVKTGTLNTYDNTYGLIRDINNYWDMRDYFFNEYLKPFLYTGKYYYNQTIIRLLAHKKNKDKLYDKILDSQMQQSIDDIFSYNQLNQLQALKINPIQNNFSADNPLDAIFTPKLKPVTKSKVRRKILSATPV